VLAEDTRGRFCTIAAGSKQGLEGGQGSMLRLGRTSGPLHEYYKSPLLYLPVLLFL